jgi:hypothetical protein
VEEGIVKDSRQLLCTALALALGVGGVLLLQAICPLPAVREAPFSLALHGGGTRPGTLPPGGAGAAAA